MKISRFLFVISLVVIVAAVSFGYSLHTATRLQELEQRLAATAVRIHNLEERVQVAEAASVRAHFAGGGGSVNTFGLEQRVQKIEQQITPHLEVLPPYVLPDR